MDLTGIKVGDTVFVVHQQRRRQSEIQTETSVVTRVGRDYGYIDNRQFDLKTGLSVHKKDHNVRANGCGFDVYHNRDEYEQEKRQKDEYTRLVNRLRKSQFDNRLIELPPEAVAKIHAILDELT